jgi:hypothetical protein
MLLARLLLRLTLRDFFDTLLMLIFTPWHCHNTLLPFSPPVYFVIPLFEIVAFALTPSLLLFTTWSPYHAYWRYAEGIQAEWRPTLLRIDRYAQFFRPPQQTYYQTYFLLHELILFSHYCRSRILLHEINITIHSFLVHIASSHILSSFSSFMPPQTLYFIFFPPEISYRQYRFDNI